MNKKFELQLQLLINKSLYKKNIIDEKKYRYVDDLLNKDGDYY